MSLLNRQNDEFYAAQPKEGWTLKEYAKAVGQTIVLNISDEAISISDFTGLVLPWNPHMVIAQLVQVEVLVDSMFTVYLLTLGSGIQALISVQGKESDTIATVEAALAPTPRPKRTTPLKKN